MKIEIGSGKRPHKGYQTIDIEEYSGADIIGDFRTMTFSDIEEIRAHHVLEHFSREEGFLVLSQWRNWLRRYGTLIVETPDFEYICKEFEKQDSKGKYWITRHTYGSQEADWAFHRDGWYEDKFKRELPRLGYEIVSISRNISRGYLPNIVVTARKVGT